MIVLRECNYLKPFFLYEEKFLRPHPLHRIPSSKLIFKFEDYFTTAFAYLNPIVLVIDLKLQVKLIFYWIAFLLLRGAIDWFVDKILMTRFRAYIVAAVASCKTNIWLILSKRSGNNILVDITILSTRMVSQSKWSQAVYRNFEWVFVAILLFNYLFRRFTNSFINKIFYRTMNSRIIALCISMLCQMYGTACSHDELVPLM